MKISSQREMGRGALRHVKPDFFVQSNALRSAGGMSASTIPRSWDAFTLLEVMIASGIFFMAIFAILSLVSSNIRNARLLQQPQVDAGLLLSDLVQTNKLTEGSDSGDFGDLYPGYRWSSDIVQVATNGLFKVEYTISRPGGGPNSSIHDQRLIVSPRFTEGGGLLT